MLTIADEILADYSFLSRYHRKECLIGQYIFRPIIALKSNLEEKCMVTHKG